MSNPSFHHHQTPYVRHTIGKYSYTIHPRYVNLKLIGKGAYGLVASAFDEYTKRPVAIKKISKVFANLTDAKRIMREVQLLRHFPNGGVPHENIIDIFDLMTSPPEKEDFDTLYIVTELFEADLSRILNSSQDLTEQHAIYFTYQLLRGLKYIHSAGVIHRDLKPSNLLVNGNCDLAICDFGLARGLSETFESDKALTEYVQTRWYRAPELICQTSVYGPEIDMWSVGTILGEILSRKPFLQGSSSADQLLKIIRLIGTPSDATLANCKASQDAIQFIKNQPYCTPKNLREIFPSASDNALDLLSRLLRFDPHERISIDDAMVHPFLKELHDRAPPAPVCNKLFDYSIEAKYKDTEMPQSVLQNLIFKELIILREEQYAWLYATPNSVGNKANLSF